MISSFYSLCFLKLYENVLQAILSLAIFLKFPQGDILLYCNVLYYEALY